MCLWLIIVDLRRILLLLFVMKYILLFVVNYINPELNRQRIPNSLSYSTEQIKTNDLFEAKDLHSPKKLQNLFGLVER